MGAYRAQRAITSKTKLLLIDYFRENRNGEIVTFELAEYGVTSELAMDRFIPGIHVAWNRLRAELTARQVKVKEGKLFLSKISGEPPFVITVQYARDANAEMSREYDEIFKDVFAKDSAK